MACCSPDGTVAAACFDTDELGQPASPLELVGYHHYCAPLIAAHVLSQTGALRQTYGAQLGRVTMGIAETPDQLAAEVREQQKITLSRFAFSVFAAALTLPRQMQSPAPRAAGAPLPLIASAAAQASPLAAAPAAQVAAVRRLSIHLSRFD